MKILAVVGEDQVELYLNGKKIRPFHIKTKFNNKEELKAIIAVFDMSNPCKGVWESTPSDVAERRIAIKYGGKLRSLSCTWVTTKTDQCVVCRTLKMYLMKRK